MTDIKGEKYKYHTGVEVKKPEQNEEYSGGSNTNAFSHNLNTNKHPTILIAETPCLLSNLYLIKTDHVQHEKIVICKNVLVYVKRTQLSIKDLNPNCQKT